MVKPLLVANIIEEGRWGGPQKRISQVAGELHKHGVETVVILPIADSTHFQRELKERQIRFEILKLQRLSGSLGALARYFISFVPDVFRLIRCLRRKPFDAVHISGGAWQIKGAIAGRLAGIPVIWHLNDSQMPKPVVFIFQMLANKLASAFIVTADRCRRYYLSTPKLSKFQVFPIQAPVDTRNYDPAQITPDTRIASYPGVRVVSVANINPIKGLDILVDAAGIVLDDSGNFSFLIAGPVYETQRQYFERLQEHIARLGISEHIHFVGGVQNVAAVVGAADIYVCSSLSESGPMTLWEAMAMERAVVSTDVGDVSSYVCSGENGYVVPVGDSKALAARIKKLAADAELRRQFGKRAREVVLQKIDLEIIGACTAACYQQVVGFQNSKSAHVRLQSDAAEMGKMMDDSNSSLLKK